MLVSIFHTCRLIEKGACERNSNNFAISFPIDEKSWKTPHAIFLEMSHARVPKGINDLQNITSPMLRHLNRFTFAAFIIGFLLCYTAMLLTGGGHTDEAIWDVTCYNDLVGYSQAGITELLGKPDDKLVVFGATPPPELSPESLLVWKNSSYQYGLIYGNIELRFNQFDRVFQVSPVKWSDGRVAPLLNKMNPHASQ